MYLSAYDHPYEFILPEERREFERQITSQYTILVKLARNLPDLKKFRLDLCYYYFVDIMLSREGINPEYLERDEYAYHVSRFEKHPDVLRYSNDMMTFFVLYRFSNQSVTNKGGSFSCIARSAK